MATLYRKYRPTGFSSIYGQNHIRAALEQAVKAGKLAHAFLFCGPRGVGKTTMARVLAKSVNCANRPADKAEPCGACQNCEMIQNGRDLDLIEIDAASHTGVDNVRENIIAVSRLAPSFSKYKVFIIDEAHMLSVSAFNALLKVMEEPPQNVIFILCTTEVHKIPTTIISRCERYDFRKIKTAEIVACLEAVAKLENVKIERPELEAIARFSDGYMRDALSLLGQVFSIGGAVIKRQDVDLVVPRSEIAEISQFVGLLCAKKSSQAIELLNKFLDDGIDLKKFANDTLEFLRVLLLRKINPAMAMLLPYDFGEEIEKSVLPMLQALEISHIHGMLEKLMEARKKIDGNFIAQLPLEMAIIEICLLSSPQDYSAVQFSAKSKNDFVAAPRAEAPSSGQAEIEAKAIAAKWHEVLAKIKKHNHSLSFILRVCEPKSVIGNRVCLAFKYKFHKDRIDDANIRQIIETVMKEVYGLNLLVEAILDEGIVVANEEKESKAEGADSFGMVLDKSQENVNNDKSGENSNEVVKKILETFGGKVVNE